MSEEAEIPKKSRHERLKDANMTDLHAAIHHLTNACDLFKNEEEKANRDKVKISDEIHECFDEVGYAMTAVSKALSRILYG